MDSRTVSAQEAIFRRVDGAGCMFRLQFPDFRATRRSGKCRIPCFLSIFQEERNPAIYQGAVQPESLVVHPTRAIYRLPMQTNRGQRSSVRDGYQNPLVNAV